MPPHDHVYFPVDGKDEPNDYIFFSMGGLATALEITLGRGENLIKALAQARQINLPEQMTPGDGATLNVMIIRERLNR